MNTDKNGKKNQLSQTFAKVFCTIFILVCNISVTGQVVIKGETHLSVKTDSVFHSDTVIYQKTANTLKSEKSVAKLYVVKGTLISDLAENNQIEIVYIEAPKPKQKQKEVALAKSNKTERSIAQPQKKPETKKNTFFVSRAPKGNTDLITGKEIIAVAVNFTPTVKKEVSIVKNELLGFRVGFKINLINHYFNEKIVSSLDPKSIKVRPPPIYI